MFGIPISTSLGTLHVCVFAFFSLFFYYSLELFSSVWFGKFLRFLLRNTHIWSNGRCRNLIKIFDSDLNVTNEILGKFCIAYNLPLFLHASPSSQLIPSTRSKCFVPMYFQCKFTVENHILKTKVFEILFFESSIVIKTGGYTRCSRCRHKSQIMCTYLKWTNKQEKEHRIRNNIN